MIIMTLQIRNIIHSMASINKKKYLNPSLTNPYIYKIDQKKINSMQEKNSFSSTKKRKNLHNLR